MYIEGTTMICKTCKEDKQKEPIIRGGVTRFVDAGNRMWNGKVCPDCYRFYNRQRMQLKRKSLKSKD
jgi:type II secretory ATPase GspE/PulE/Tfp pilus assembly ATPase PilB-like protein